MSIRQIAIAIVLLCACAGCKKAPTQSAPAVDLSSPTNTIQSLWRMQDFIVTEAAPRLQQEITPFLTQHRIDSLTENRRVKEQQARLTPLVRQIKEAQIQPGDQALVITEEQLDFGSTNHTSYRYSLTHVQGKWVIDDTVRPCWRCDATGKETWGEDKGEKCKHCKGLGWVSIWD